MLALEQICNKNQVISTEATVALPLWEQSLVKDAEVDGVLGLREPPKINGTLLSQIVNLALNSESLGDCDEVCSHWASWNWLMVTIFQHQSRLNFHHVLL